ncbi:MAG: glycine cleavage T C-terminal barrel domain-containing protein [Acidimicrobiales bacterium]|nr:glycine cleavage T C-terminal barrel domain-containing protein [Acidimicrobiales bacterium]
MDGTDLRNTLGAVAVARDVVLVHGPEAVAFLQGQLSQDVDGLAVGASAPAFLLQPTGKVEAVVRITRSADDEVLLDVDAGWGEAVLARLRRFKLRTKADLDPATWTGVALRGPGAGEAAASMAVDGARHLPACWPGVEAADVLGPDGATSFVELAGERALEALRVEAGVPAMGREVSGSTIPAELGQWLIDASVSFTKGCYTGQELVARIDSRGGNVPKPLRGLVLDATGAEAGASVLHGGADVGRVTSVAMSSALGPVALALVGRGVAPGTAVEVGTADGLVTATVAELPLR